MAKNKTLNVKGTEIVLYRDKQEDFISLTDIARYRDSERSDYVLQNWMRNRSTIEFIGLWEQFNNPGFNSIEFDGIKNTAGSNREAGMLWLPAEVFHGIASCSLSRPIRDRIAFIGWNFGELLSEGYGGLGRWGLGQGISGLFF